MASLNFDESIVLILFAQAGLGTRPSRAEVVQFDANLQQDFGKKLHDSLTQEGMDLDIHNRSVVLGCRPHMAGNTADTQIRNACRFAKHAQGELNLPSGAPVTRSAQAAPRVASAGRAAGPRAAATKRPSRRGGKKASRPK